MNRIQTILEWWLTMDIISTNTLHKVFWIVYTGKTLIHNMTVFHYVVLHYTMAVSSCSMSSCLHCSIDARRHLWYDGISLYRSTLHHGCFFLFNVFMSSLFHWCPKTFMIWRYFTISFHVTPWLFLPVQCLHVFIVPLMPEDIHDMTVFHYIVPRYTMAVSSCSMSSCLHCFIDARRHLWYDGISLYRSTLHHGCFFLFKVFMSSLFHWCPKTFMIWRYFTISFHVTPWLFLPVQSLHVFIVPLMPEDIYDMTVFHYIVPRYTMAVSSCSMSSCLHCSIDARRHLWYDGISLYRSTLHHGCFFLFNVFMSSLFHWCPKTSMIWRYFTISFYITPWLFLPVQCLHAFIVPLMTKDIGSTIWRYFTLSFYIAPWLFLTVQCLHLVTVPLMTMPYLRFHDRGSGMTPV